MNCVSADWSRRSEARAHSSSELSRVDTGEDPNSVPLPGVCRGLGRRESRLVGATCGYPGAPSHLLERKAGFPGARRGPFDLPVRPCRDGNQETGFAGVSPTDRPLPGGSRQARRRGTAGVAARVKPGAHLKLGAAAFPALRSDSLHSDLFVISVSHSLCTSPRTIDPQPTPFIDSPSRGTILIPARAYVESRPLPPMMTGMKRQ